MRAHARATRPAAADPADFAQAMAARLRQAVLDALVRIGGEDDDDRPALTIERSPVPLAPARLAMARPAGPARDEARALYERCLAAYRGTLRAQDEALGRDDVGAAVAAFVASNLCALHGGTVTAPMLLKLERQLGGIVRLSADWDHAPARERQAYFEQMAIIAVLIADCSAQAALQGEAAVTHVQRAARGYLQDLLGLDPDHLAIGPDGLAARRAA